MRIQLKNIGSLLLALLVITVALSSCESENWKKHYDLDQAVVSDKNAWETIKADPQFSKFAWAARVTGYDKVLSSSQMLTIWVPENSALANLDTTSTNVDKDALLKEFVQNHVSRFSYPASGTKESRILLMNKKQLNFKNLNSEFYIGDAKTVKNNIVASNALIHVISTQVPFFRNIWEYISKTEDLDSIRSFFFSYNKIVFDEAKSIPGGVNDNGQIVYLDSVIYNYNQMFTRLGEINSEDSTYSMLIPTNTAWNSSYAKIQNYYNYYYNTPANKITADTLQRKNTMLALTRDLVFSHSVQEMTNDSLISNNVDNRYTYSRESSIKKFYKPFANAFKIDRASNGMVYVTNEIPYLDWESWHRPITIEAERTSGRISTWANIFERNYQDIEFAVSGKRYIEVNPTTASVNPTVTFDVPNTLSGQLNTDGTIKQGGAYNIYVVMLPNKLKSSNNPKPNKLNFSLTYTSEDKGKLKTVDYNNNKLSYETDPLKLSKVLVASNVVLPYCEVGLITPTVKFKVTSNVASKETSTHTRDLLIDCVIFEPAH